MPATLTENSTTSSQAQQADSKTKTQQADSKKEYIQLLLFPGRATPPREPINDPTGNNVIQFPSKTKTTDSRPIRWYRHFFSRKGIPIYKIREWGGCDCRHKQTYINAYEYYRRQRMGRKTKEAEASVDSSSDRVGRAISREIKKEKATTTATTSKGVCQATTGFVPPPPKPPIAPSPEPEEESRPRIVKPPQARVGAIIKITSGVGLAGDRHDKFFEVIDTNYCGVFYMHEGEKYWEQETGYEVCDDFW